MSKRPRHSDGSSHSEKKMGTGTQSEDRRERRNKSSTKDGYGPSGATPSGCHPFTPQGSGLTINGPLDCGPSTHGFGPPGCFSSKPQGPGLLGAKPKGLSLLCAKPKVPGLLGASSLRRQQVPTKGPSLLGAGPRRYEPLRPKGPGYGPLGCEPSTTTSHGSTRIDPNLLEKSPKFKFPGSMGIGPRLLEASPTTTNLGARLMEASFLSQEPTKSPSLLGDGHEPTKSPSLLGDGPIGHEPFTNYSARLPSFSPVPVQKLNNNFAQGVSSESEEFRNKDIAPGLKEEPHWKSQIRELKQYVVKLENDKCQMSEQVKKMNNYIIKLQIENSRLIAINESNNKVKNAIAGQIFKQHPQQLGERELNLVVEKVYAKLKCQNPSPFGMIEATSTGNSYAPHSNQNQVSADSERNFCGNKSVNDEDNEIQIIEPVKKESYDPYDHLDLDDIVVLLKTFKELEKSEQENLLAYIKKLEKKFPEKARILNAKFNGVM